VSTLSATAHVNKQIALHKQRNLDERERQKTIELAEKALDESSTPKDIVDLLVEKVLVFPDNALEIVWSAKDFCIPTLS
jgi:hypothetical protein